MSQEAARGPGPEGLIALTSQKSTPAGQALRTEGGGGGKWEGVPLAKKKEGAWNDTYLDHANVSNVCSLLHRAHVCQTCYSGTFLYIVHSQNQTYFTENL